MNNLDSLEKEKMDIIARHHRELDAIEARISKEKERIKREKEYEKKKKEQQQNNLAGAEDAYQSFVKDSMSIVEINNILEKLLNQK